MLLTQRGKHTHELALSAGVVLFSYANAVAAKIGDCYYVQRGPGRHSRSTEGHIADWLAANVPRGLESRVQYVPDIEAIIVQHNKAADGQ